MEEKYVKMEEASKLVLNKIESYLYDNPSVDEKEFLKTLEKDILATNNVDLFFRLLLGDWSRHIYKKAYEKAIIESKDPKYNYLFAQRFYWDEEVENAVLESKNPENSYLFAKDISGSNKKAHAKVVLESKNPEYNYLFARDISVARKRAHARVVLESKNPKYNYLYMIDVPGANEKAHSKVILESKDPEYNCKAALYMYGKEKRSIFTHKETDKHVQVVLDSKDLIANFKLTTSLSFITVPKSIQIIIDSKDLEYNYQMALKKRKFLSEHEQVILDAKNINYIYKFVKHVEGADIEAHRQVILEAQKRNHLEEDERKIMDKFLKEFPCSANSNEIANMKSLIKKYKFD